MAATSFASSTTHSSVASRRGSRQIAHGSSSARFPQVPHAITCERTRRIACASRSAASAGSLSRWNASRCAVLDPIPGSLASSVTRSSMADTSRYNGNWNGKGIPPESFRTSACCSSAARFCTSATAASTRSSSISTSPWRTTSGAIVMARIWPRPSAVACTIPPPADTVTVCCASCDWISVSRPCICCPNWSRLDKSAIRRKLPLAYRCRKLLEQLQIQGVDRRAQRLILAAQQLQPLRVGGLRREARRPFTTPGRGLPDPLHADPHRLGEILPHELGERVALVVDARRVPGVAVEHADGDDPALGGDDRRLSQQRPEHRTRDARVGDDARPERLQSLERERAPFGGTVRRLRRCRTVGPSDRRTGRR